MKPQTRFMSAVESTANIAVGLGIQMAANFIVLPWFGFDVTVGQVAAIAAIMTVVSVVRSYGLRRLFEALRIRNAPPAFQYIVEEIASERLRQINGEGFSLAHDDTHNDGSLAAGAAAYAFAGSLQTAKRRDPLAFWGAFPRDNDLSLLRQLWRYRTASFKPTTPRRDLIKASAMIIAEIGRLDRIAGKAAS